MIGPQMSHLSELQSSHHADESSLDLANAVRSLVVLRWEQASKVLCEDVRTLYTGSRIEAGIKESTARVAALSNL